MSKFRCGVESVAQGSAELTFSVDIGFVPESLHVQVRQPEADADLIDAKVIGTPTASGFTVALSSPATADGYLLDWTAFKSDGGEIVVRGECRGVLLREMQGEGGFGYDPYSLAVTYSDLAKSVAKFLGYDHANLTDEQKDEVDCIIQSGVRNFYYPPAMDGVDPNFEWSFLKMEGSVVTAPGVSEYLLPDGFNRFSGAIIIKDAENFQFRNAFIVPYGNVKSMLDNGHRTGVPHYAASLGVNQYGEKGQLRKLYLYPVPDAAYTLDFSADMDFGRLSDENPFPLGGAMYAELLRESCLAVAERDTNDEEGIHLAAFNRLIVSTIARDRKASAQNFGFIGVQDAPRW